MYALCRCSYRYAPLPWHVMCKASLVRNFLAPLLCPLLLARYPVECVQTVGAICRQAEACFNSDAYYRYIMKSLGAYSVNPNMSKVSYFYVFAIGPAGCGQGNGAMLCNVVYGMKRAAHILHGMNNELFLAACMPASHRAVLKIACPQHHGMLLSHGCAIEIHPRCRGVIPRRCGPLVCGPLVAPRRPNASRRGARPQRQPQPTPCNPAHTVPAA